MGGGRNADDAVFQLRQQTSLDFVAGYTSGEEALNAIPGERPDVALVNFTLPFMDGFECARKLSVLFPDMPVLMFQTGSINIRSETDESLIFAAIHAGACGYVPAKLPESDWVEAIQRVFNRSKGSRRPFLMFFDSDKAFGRILRHWGKVISILHVYSAAVRCEDDWRKIVLFCLPRNQKTLHDGPLPGMIAHRDSIIPNGRSAGIQLGV